MVFLGIAFFFTFLDGLKKVLTKDKELQFLEINEDSLRYRRFDGGSVDAISASSIELILVAPSHLEVGTSGVSYTLFINHGCGSVHELVEIFGKICPQAIIKITQCEDN